jgi:hypothetical protein
LHSKWRNAIAIEEITLNFIRRYIALIKSGRGTAAMVVALELITSRDASSTQEL